MPTYFELQTGSVMSRLDTTADLLQLVHQEIGAELVRTEEIFDEELASTNPFVGDIIAHTRRFRGKRLRPILLLLTAKACGNISDAHPILAAVVEMIHTATLVHDDVLDMADVRRHVATVNVRWNNETSVLFGDYLFTHAFHLAASIGTADACRIIGRATNRVCEGELSQVRHRGDLDLTEEAYFDMIDGKTAELCAVACLLGAKYADSSSTVVDALREYGRELGLAFQIADDVLDIMGTEDAIGKTLGTDLDQQKLTLPVIRLLSSLSSEEANELRRQIRDDGCNAGPEIIRLCQEKGILEETASTAQEIANRAAKRLSILPESPARRLLELLPGLAINRVC
ncbi:MAG: polyprenyl synthetase family protein [Planctomycetaceae bacterium]|nr:polyprenyl synthetase family protein [Planctomycetaceae bacterium]